METIHGASSEYTQFTVLFHIYKTCFILEEQPASQLAEQKGDTKKPNKCTVAPLHSSAVPHSTAAHTTPSTGGATSAQDTEGGSPFFLEFSVKLGNHAATQGQRQYLMKGGGKVVHEYQWEVRSWAMTSFHLCREGSLLNPVRRVPTSQLPLHHCDDILGVFHLSNLYVSTLQFEYTFPKLIYIN